MASKILSCFALTLAFCLSGALGAITCERLGRSACAYAVSAEGMRCVLEKRSRAGGKEEYTCRASRIEAEGIRDWIETDECVDACGLDRSALGISSDALLDARLTQKLCSPECYRACPNIVDLYFNLAAGEGVFLPKLCGASSARRSMAEIKSSNVVLAEGPVSSEEFLAAAPVGTTELFDLAPVLPPV